MKVEISNKITKSVERIRSFAVEELSEEFEGKIQGGINEDRVIITCDDADGKYILVHIIIEDIPEHLIRKENA